MDPNQSNNIQPEVPAYGAGEVQPVQQPVQQPEKKSNKGLAIGLAVGGVLIIAAIVAVLVLGNDKNGSSDSGSGKEGSSQTGGGGDGGNNGGGTAQTGVVEKSIDQKIVDEELGYTITVKRVMYNIPLDDDWWAESSKSVAVEVEVDNHSLYMNSFSSYDLTININGQKVSNSRNYFEKYIEEKDMVLLPDSTARGSKSLGWILFRYDDTLKGEIKFIYERSEYKITDGKSVPAKNYTVNLD